MSILNLGSCCIDHVYHVPNFVRPGETLPCSDYEIHPGGKGLNQSVAIARAGTAVRHAGKIGEDGQWLKEVLQEAGADTSLLHVCPESTGHANIQVNANGENAIVLYGGTNRQIMPEDISNWLAECQPGDYLVLQNEISELTLAMQLAAEKGLRTIFNAAPMTESVTRLPLETLDTLIINEIEGETLSGSTSPEDIIDALSKRLPKTNIVLTLGADGALLKGPAGSFRVTSPTVDTVDTTGAGDTFTGYFIAGYAENADIEKVLKFACKAAALSVTRAGAASSIPERREVDAAAP